MLEKIIDKVEKFGSKNADILIAQNAHRHSVLVRSAMIYLIAGMAGCAGCIMADEFLGPWMKMNPGTKANLDDAMGN